MKPFRCKLQHPNERRAGVWPLFLDEKIFVDAVNIDSLFHLHPNAMLDHQIDQLRTIDRDHPDIDGFQVILRALREVRGGDKNSLVSRFTVSDVLTSPSNRAP